MSEWEHEWVSVDVDSHIHEDERDSEVTYDSSACTYMHWPQPYVLQWVVKYAHRSFTDKKDTYMCSHPCVQVKQHQLQ